MFGRDKSERFQSSLPSPGPGHYDPSIPRDNGYKKDLRSSFQGSGRFSADTRDDGSGNFSSPPRRIPSRSGSRAADWTTNRIKDLETELRISKAKILELQQVVRESNLCEISKDEVESELRDMKNELLQQKASALQAQREAIQAETNRKKLESEQANLEMRVRKAEENRKISEAKASEAKYKITELEKQVTKMEDEYDEMEEDYRKEIQALKKRLSAAESSMSKPSQDQLNSLQQWSERQKEQIQTLEIELGASKAAAENLTAENLAEILVVKAELAVVSERELEKDVEIETLRSEIAELKARIEKILQEKAELEAELVSMKEENDQKAKQIAEITEALKQSEEQLKARDEIVSELESKLAEIQKQKEKSEESLKKAEESASTLKQDLLSKTQDFENLENKIDGVARTVGDGEIPADSTVHDRLDLISKAVAGHLERVAELEKSKDGQANEVQHLQNKVATVLREKKVKAGELERQRKEEKSLRRSLAEQEKRINDLSKEMKEAESKATKESSAKTALEKELKSVRSQLGEKTGEVAELQRQAETLSKEKAAGENEKEKLITDMQKELETARAELANNSSAVQDLQSQVENAGKSAGEQGTELASLQTSLQQARSEKDQLSALLETHQQELSDFKKKHGEQESLLSEVQVEVDKLKEQLSEANKAKTAAEEMNKQTIQEKTSLEDKLSKSKEVQKTAQSTINTQTQDITKLTAAKTALESALEAAQQSGSKENSAVATKLTSMQQTLKEREDEIRDLHSELGEVVRNNEMMKGSGQKTQAKLSKVENEVRQKTSLIQELQSQVKVLKQENTELSREQEQAITSSKNKMAEKDKKLQRYEREIASLKEKIDGNSSQLTSQQDMPTIEKLQAEIEKQKKKYESQIRSLQIEPRSMKDLRSEVSSAQSATLQVRKQNEILKKQLQEVLDRLAFFESTEEGEERADLGEVDVLRESLREAQRKVSEAQKLAAHYRMQLRQSETMKLEMDRLTEENSYLSSRTEQLNADVSGLMRSSGSVLGHHNSKQKIQYHLKLKTELEEMRKEYTILSREKFKLEQAIRYMAARADLMNGNPVSDVSGTGIRHPSAAVAPASTKESVVLSTPTAKKHMKWASRGRGTTKNMSAYKPRESMERGIEETQVETVIESEAFKHDASEENLTPVDEEAVRPGSSTDCVLAPLAHLDSVENRILSTISSVVSRRRRRSHLVVEQ